MFSFVICRFSWRFRHNLPSPQWCSTASEFYEPINYYEKQYTGRRLYIHKVIGAYIILCISYVRYISCRCRIITYRHFSVHFKAPNSRFSIDSLIFAYNYIFFVLSMYLLIQYPYYFNKIHSISTWQFSFTISHLWYGLSLFMQKLMFYKKYEQYLKHIIY